MSSALFAIQLSDSSSSQAASGGAQPNRADADDSKAAGGSFEDSLNSAMGADGRDSQPIAQSNYLNALANAAPANSAAPESFESQLSGSKASPQADLPTSSRAGPAAANAKPASWLKGAAHEQPAAEEEAPGAETSASRLQEEKSTLERSALQAGQLAEASTAGASTPSKSRSSSSKSTTSSSSAPAKKTDQTAPIFAGQGSVPAPIAGAKNTGSHADTGARGSAEHASSAVKKLASSSSRSSSEPAPASGSKAATATISSSPTSAIATGSTSAKPLASSAPAAVPFAREADADPSLHLSLMPQAAHLKMDLDGAGALDLHLRLRDGAAHVTVAGPAAALVDSHSADLRTSLASHGVSLASVAQVPSSEGANNNAASGEQLPQDRSQGEREQAPRESLPTATRADSRDRAAFTISRSSASTSAS